MTGKSFSSSYLCRIESSNLEKTAILLEEMVLLMKATESADLGDDNGANFQMRDVANVRNSLAWRHWWLGSHTMCQLSLQRASAWRRWIFVPWRGACRRRWCRQLFPRRWWRQRSLGTAPWLRASRGGIGRGRGWECKRWCTGAPPPATWGCWIDGFSCLQLWKWWRSPPWVLWENENSERVKKVEN